MKKNKKKILMMSDDLRMHSGVAVMSKEIVMGAIHHYDFVQIGGSVKHPEEGKIVDMSQAVRESIGVKDLSNFWIWQSRYVKTDYRN